jgi:hypothetical protein
MVSVPLSDTARAIQVLDQRYGPKGWVVKQSIFSREDWLVSLRPLWVDGRCRSLGCAVAPTARDAILAAAARVEAATREIAA